ncbi:hypothetical protein C8A03DRAFT_43228 [Achaetomium macrosporum]|uniref:DNA polymerase eta n=1 Tax=Achaetomium macrosporum TaxID=79813 RepID=A0AAN7CD77_9PEZI|nr:hypothetical protein C8A03DRAFT_43228 [Achaetomium macrosporum]
MVSARRAETRWVTRIIPLVLGGCVGFATYVIVKHICVDFFVSDQKQRGTAVAFLVLYFVLFLLALLTYLRVFIVIQLNPGVTPLGPRAASHKANAKPRGRRERDLEAATRYEARPDDNPDSPGLEKFYSKDVFVCETDGRPRWCSTCCNWKIDRAHHCSEIERCVKKMDHYCPWVGGIVAETSFKFFVQFTFYTSLYCVVVIVAAIICLESKVRRGDGADGLAIAALALGAFFGLFTLTMTLTSVRYILINLTTVDYVKSKNVVHQLAIRVPRGTPPGQNYNVITYPLPTSTSTLDPSGHEFSSTRDQLATRTFAIVRTEMGENPWDLGYYRNWKSVMGDSIIDWLLPFNESPCAKYENNESFYEMGPLYQRLRVRFGLPDVSTEERRRFSYTAMSSPQHSFRDLSPAGALERRRSQFTYRNLSQMASYNTSCPLRVVAHIDLDCFYAQAEMVRLGVPEDQPLAVQQWQGLIAVNYPARAYGIGRMCTVTEAKKLCPNLIHQHVATWREGDDKWAYRPDAAENIATDKVSLDPYRLESRRILAVIKEQLPPHLQKVEKASIDEVFLDLSAHVHAVLLERFPELASLPPGGDPSEPLPMPPVSALDWQADALVDLDDEHAEFDDPDWDDVALLLASEIVRNIRAAIREQLRYTCAAGIARNKLLSKLGSAHKKPNQQTVIRNRAIRHFLSGFNFTKFRNLGGKLGEQVRLAFNTDSVQELLGVSVEQLKLRLGDDTGMWVYNTLRGIDTSEVNPRTQIKSMLSAKSFRPSINSTEQATRWLKIFVADIFARLVEEGVLENKRRPKTINLHHRHGNLTRSRQSPIPQGRSLDEQTLFGLAKTLLNQVVQEGHVWPCSNLSLSVGGFEDGISGNMGIGAFLLKGEEAEPSAPGRRTRVEVEASKQPHPAEKRRRMDDGGIQRFLTRTKTSPSLGSDEAAGEDDGGEALGIRESKAVPVPVGDSSGLTEPDEIPGAQSNDLADAHPCSRCNACLESSEALQSHQDWHFAKDLQEQERVALVFGNHPPVVAANPQYSGQQTGPAAPKRPRRPRKMERGQKKLNFG